MGEFLVIAAAMLFCWNLLSIPIGLTLHWRHQNQLNALRKRIQLLEEQQPFSEAETSKPRTESERAEEPQSPTSAEPAKKHPSAFQPEARSDQVVVPQPTTPIQSPSLSTTVHQPNQTSQRPSEWQGRWQQIEQQLLRN